MPILTLSSKTALTPDAKNEIGKVLTELTAEHLGKNAALTVVRFHDDIHFYSGSEVAPSGQFALEIKVTQGTNTKGQIASFQQSAHKSLATLLEAVGATNYITVEEVPAANWGFGGISQEARAHL